MRKLKFFHPATLFTLLLISSNLAFAQQNRSTISGFVFDQDRRPVPEVYVELRSEFSTIGRVRTDGSGRYYFGGLPQGRFSVKVLPMGTRFQEQIEEIEIAGIGVRGQSLPENVQKDIYLKPRKNASNAPFQNVVVFAQDVPKEAEDYYRKAVDDLGSNRIAPGIEKLENAVASFPRYFLALQRLAIVRLAQNRFEEAADLFRRAAAVNDRCFDCWYGLSFASYSVRKLEESVSSGVRAISLKADSFEAHLLLGMSYRLTKELGSAETNLRQAVKLANGTCSDCHWQLALLYGKDMSKYAEAAHQLEEFLKAAPEAPNKEDIKKLIRQFREKARAGV